MVKDSNLSKKECPNCGALNDTGNLKCIKCKNCFEPLYSQSIVRAKQFTKDNLMERSPEDSTILVSQLTPNDKTK